MTGQDKTINFSLIGKNWGRNYLKNLLSIDINLKNLSSTNALNFDDNLKNILMQWDEKQQINNLQRWSWCSWQKACQDVDLVIIAADAHKHFEMLHLRLHVIIIQVCVIIYQHAESALKQSLIFNIYI